MATRSITLTNSPVKVSEAGCLISSESEILIGFSASNTAPTLYHKTFEEKLITYAGTEKVFAKSLFLGQETKIIVSDVV